MAVFYANLILQGYEGHLSYATDVMLYSFTKETNFPEEFYKIE